MRVSTGSGVSKGDISFEIARIVVVRPWFDACALVAGQVRFSENEEPVSDGMKPSELVLPSVRIGAYVEELVLIRGIRINGTLAVENHPLSSIATPDSINLLGFVIRSLPKLPR